MIKIGIGGYAKSGKDTLCNMLLDKLNKMHGPIAIRMALADELKQKIRPQLLEKYNIDVLNCTPEEKEIIRPELVQFGKVVREGTKGTGWTSIVQEKTKNIPEEIVIIPDIRYAEYEADEVQWIKKNGILLHVSKYTVADGQKIWNQPPNEDEANNDPRVKAQADFILSWPALPIDQLNDLYDGFVSTIARYAMYELGTIKRHGVN